VRARAVWGSRLAAAPAGLGRRRVFGAPTAARPRGHPPLPTTAATGARRAASVAPRAPRRGVALTGVRGRRGGARLSSCVAVRRRRRVCTPLGEALERALSGEELSNVELPVLTNTPSVIAGRSTNPHVQIFLNTSCRRDKATNAVVGVIGIGQDVSALIAHEREREFAWQLDTANAPIFGIDTKGNVNVWNQCAATMTGHSADEAMGVNLVSHFISSDYQRSVQEVFDNALNGKETANFEFPMITKHGARIEILLNASPRRDEHRVIYGVVGIGQDITARRIQEQEYVRLIDQANAPIFGIDVGGHVNVWNQHAVHLTQARRDIAPRFFRSGSAVVGFVPAWLFPHAY
jgi:PAS domain S-box-containing protein